MVYRFLTRISGHREVGEEDDRSHGQTDHLGRNGLVMMHEGGELWVRIRKIDLLVFDVVEMFHQLQVRMFRIFVFKPSPGLGGGLLFDLIPDPDI